MVTPVSGRPIYAVQFLLCIIDRTFSSLISDISLTSSFIYRTLFETYAIIVFTQYNGSIAVGDVSSLYWYDETVVGIIICVSTSWAQEKYRCLHTHLVSYPAPLAHTLLPRNLPGHRKAATLDAGSYYSNTLLNYAIQTCLGSPVLTWLVHWLAWTAFQDCLGNWQKLILFAALWPDYTPPFWWPFSRYSSDGWDTLNSYWRDGGWRRFVIPQVSISRWRRQIDTLFFCPLSRFPGLTSVGVGWWLSTAYPRNLIIDYSRNIFFTTQQTYRSYWPGYTPLLRSTAIPIIQCSTDNQPKVNSGNRVMQRQNKTNWAKPGKATGQKKRGEPFWANNTGRNNQLTSWAWTVYIPRPSDIQLPRSKRASMAIIPSLRNEIGSV